MKWFNSILAVSQVVKSTGICSPSLLQVNYLTILCLCSVQHYDDKSLPQRIVVRIIYVNTCRVPKQHLAFKCYKAISTIMNS